MITVPNFHNCKTLRVVGHFFIDGQVSYPLSLAPSWFVETKQVAISHNNEFIHVSTSQHHIDELNAILNKHPELWGDNEDWDACAASDDIFVVEAVAEQGKALDKLINHADWGIRRLVAKQGYGLDRLVNDDSPHVRQVAKATLQAQQTCLS